MLTYAALPEAMLLSLTLDIDRDTKYIIFIIDIYREGGVYMYICVRKNSGSLCESTPILWVVVAERFFLRLCQHTSAYVASAYVSIRSMGSGHRAIRLF